MGPVFRREMERGGIRDALAFSAGLPAPEPGRTRAIPSRKAGRSSVKEWVPGDGTRHGGDGLGPVYNDTSCIACHSMGGPGGAGPANKNAEILTAISNTAPSFQVVLESRRCSASRNAWLRKRMAIGTRAIWTRSSKHKENRLKELVVQTAGNRSTRCN